jgi:uncharacterized protein YyaL (SSP411 family)
MYNSFVCGVPEHPLREALTNEIHARPPTPLRVPAQVSHLALLTGEERYEAAAREAIEAFAGAADRMGVEVAEFASAAARLQRPQVVEVGTEAGSDLHRAALRLADHETVVAPRTDADVESAAAAAPDGTARLVVDGTEQGTADSPAELESLLTE